jgi:hypothetical protein
MFGVPLLREQREPFIQFPRKQRENERTFWPVVVQKCKQTKNGEEFQPDGRLDAALDFKECMAKSQSLTRIGTEEARLNKESDQIWGSLREREGFEGVNVGLKESRA